jgi:hypothetical protein
MKYVLLWGQLITFLTFISCSPDPPRQDLNTLDSNSSNGSTGPYNPAENTSNSFEFGALKNQRSLNYPIDLDDSFRLVGTAIDNYINELTDPLDKSFCFLARYPSAPNDLLIMSAKVRSQIDIMNNTSQFYLQVYPNNKIQNSNDCLTSGIVSKMTALFPSSSLVYTANELCPNGCNRQYSDSIGLYLPSGDYVSQIDLSYLDLNIVPSSSTPVTTTTCSNDATCGALGYQCCSVGQCVNHQQVKNGVDKTSSEYLSAVEILKTKPELILNYSHLFYICTNYVTPIDDDEEADPVEENRQLVGELQDLYNCINPYLDEISICTLEDKNASETIDTTNGTDYTVEESDINFTSINASLDSNSIFNIDYGGELLYQNQLYDTDEAVALPAEIVLTNQNDSLTTAATVNIKSTLPTGAYDDLLKIRYKVDGTCVKLSANLAKCSKSYVQGQSSTPVRPSDHASGNQTFNLPSYANTSYNLIVEVNGAKVASGLTTWSKSANSVIFDSVEYPIYDNQIVKITYFVTTNVTELTAAKELAQSTVNSYCACGNEDCNLRPIFSNINGKTVIAHYECVYPFDDNTYTPLQTTVYLSAKSVPHRFYDENGVHYERNDVKDTYVQEGDKFEYTANNTLRPNNQLSSKGFNEIYGTFNLNESSPSPPAVVDVKKGKNYDIFTDEGVFSSCVTCGTDFYSNLQKIFPQNFVHKGAGYFPNTVESRRQQNQSAFRADDMLFGRACFVPATMIPWTHNEENSVLDQRRNRLAAQHAMFSNGYNRDWYGFDYGSLIGSFDGVKWFAIGNQRRIKADSNKLYIAVNAYFGDVTINNSFKVTVSEINPILYSGSSVDHDTESDGAECQQVHYCEEDNDCLTKLGYDYICENVSQIRTNWPVFDSNGNEMLGGIETSLMSLVKGSNGQNKRCVYRGRGALCGPSGSTSTNDGYSRTDQEALNNCSANHYCAGLTTSSFNTKIARYANTPYNQNASQFVNTDTDILGLGSRILGRPYDYYANSPLDNDARGQLQANNAYGMCVPGKAIDNSFDVEDLNLLIPTRTESADKMFGIGGTMEYAQLQHYAYYAACPAVDNDGGYVSRLSKTDTMLNSESYQYYPISQNLSTNALVITGMEGFDLFNDDDGGVKTKLGYEQNACLRAPGASCFTDLDCAPSRFIATKFKASNILETVLNSAEQDFWKQELVCSTDKQERYTINTNQNPDWDLTKNRCCMENGNDFTFETQLEGLSDFVVYDSGTGTVQVPGFNMDIDDPQRYSRIHTVIDKVGPIATRSEYPPLYSTQPRPAAPITDFMQNQHNTLHLHNTRVCCSQHWVRNLSKGTNANSGGHKFLNTTQQTIEPSILEPLSWLPLLAGDPVPFDCTPEDYDTPACTVRNIEEGSDYEKKWLTYLGKFELLGIPQVLIETNSTIFPDVQPLNQTSQTVAGTNQPLFFTVQDDNGTDGLPEVEIGGTRYYSAASYDNFTIGPGALKKIFSEDEFSCCLPTGVEVNSGTTDSSCCTGQRNTDDNGVTRCCLNDFTDLSVYTNAYVSSEGRNFEGVKVTDGDIDPLTGYIDSDKVLQMAAVMCCSGSAAYGSAIAELIIPINGGDDIIQQARTRRFVYQELLDNASEVNGALGRFRAGAKWNDHIYCVPDSYDQIANGTAGGSSSGGTTTTQE